MALHLYKSVLTYFPHFKPVFTVFFYMVWFPQLNGLVFLGLQFSMYTYTKNVIKTFVETRCIKQQ